MPLADSCLSEEIPHVGSGALRELLRIEYPGRTLVEISRDAPEALCVTCTIKRRYERDEKADLQGRRASLADSRNRSELRHRVPADFGGTVRSFAQIKAAGGELFGEPTSNGFV